MRRFCSLAAQNRIIFMRDVMPVTGGMDEMAEDDLTPKSENWVAVRAFDRVPPQAIVCIRLDAVDLLLVRDGEDVFACERACPHEQADLGLGRVADGRIVCPRHDASFDLRDGSVSRGWPSRDLQRYPARISAGQIWIDVSAVRSASA
jgi:3-phenylpropionate/trans-cinnamate dioxygenase ferredoxin subunit